jgi:hypothetical protein
MSSKSLLYILILLIGFQSSCKKQEPCDADYYLYEIEPCLYTFMFDTGSYWIYNNSLNGSLDSVYIEKCEFIIKSYKSGPGCGQSIGTFEFVNSDFISTLNGSFTTSMYKNKIDPEQLSPYQNRLFDCDQMELVDSLELPNNTFYNILKMETINPSAELFYKEDVGLIRKILFDSIQDSIVFDLIEYQTVSFVLPQ